MMADAGFVSGLLETAVIAARAAGELARERYGLPHDVRQKSGPRDLVSEADRAAQAIALQIIRERHPGHPILAEESPQGAPDRDGVWPIPGGVLWTVDPIDGTTNYVTGLPVFCSAVGAAIDGEPVAGAIYDPMREELIAGGRGLGVTLNGAPVPALQPVALRRSTVSLDWSRGNLTRQRVVRLVDEVSRACRTLRALGSAVLAMGYVALGRTQVYLNFGLKPWDTGAAAAIIREVGGELWRLDGTPWAFGEPGVLAGHPSVLAEVVEIAERT